MNSRLKIFLYFNSGIMLLLIVIALGIRQPVLQRFAQLEQTMMRQRLARMSDAMLQQAEKLDSEVKANSIWTAMYRYAQQPTANFYQSTFSFNGLTTSPLDVLGILDRQNRPLHLDWLNRKNRALEPVPYSIRAALLQHRYLQCKSALNRCRVFDLIPTSQGPLLVAARPIVRSDATGPSNGTVLMGRFINRTVLNQLERYNPVQVSLYVPTRTEKTQRLALDRDNPSGQPLFWIPSQIYTLGSQWISGNIYLVNGRDQISWVLSVVSPRQEYLRGEEMLNNLTLVLFLIGIPLSLISSFMLDRSIRYQQLLKRSEHALQEANQELQRLANLDSLTQIANRRCFDQQLAEEWARGLREQQPLSLILFDVDYFKQFNDAYGHQAGDDCLRTIAKRVQQVLRRPADLIARYGGEEFAVILPNTHRDGSFHLAQTILATVQNLSLAHAQSPLGRVTVSLGVATLMPSRGQSVEVLVAQSDRALYLAKQQGRNRMVSAGLQIG